MQGSVTRPAIACVSNADSRELSVLALDRPVQRPAAPQASIPLGQNPNWVEIIDLP